MIRTQKRANLTEIGKTEISQFSKAGHGCHEAVVCGVEETERVSVCWQADDDFLFVHALLVPVICGGVYVQQGKVARIV